MKAEARIDTTVTVELGDFTTHDLIMELENRGHAVDADCAADLGTGDLLSELSRRAYSTNFPKLPLDMLLRCLRDYSCPIALMQELEKWGAEPVPNLKKLEEWIASQR